METYLMSTANNYDIGIIGVGVAGAFACLKLSQEYKDLKVIAFDIGSAPQKRKNQLLGFLGAAPGSDGKLYSNDTLKVAEIVGKRSAKSALTYVNNILKNIDDFKITQDKSPQVSIEKKFKKLGYNFSLNDYTQIFPFHIHALSRYMSTCFDDNKNISFSFNNEVTKIYKQKNMFIINSEDGGEFKCKKLIIATGRSGWRWSRDLFNSFGIIESNDIARFGIRVEVDASVMDGFNNSNCTIFKGEELEIGPLSWNGTVIPEDHIDMVISAFRSNENRWNSDKVSFSLIGNRMFPGTAFEQIDRLGKLTFLLANDRVIREKISHILADKSKISILTEYDWLKPVIEELSILIPDISTKGYFHVPTLLPLCPPINIGKKLETEIEGLYVVGENANVIGILAAAEMGTIAVNSICQ